ncbi:ankyrin repeat domain-containing protein [Planctomycetota bacterium]
MKMAKPLIHMIWIASVLAGIAGCRNPIAEMETNEQFLEAITSEDVNAVKELIKSGANVNARGWSPDAGLFGTVEFTPLHYAAGSSSPEIVKMLLDAGANVHAKTHTLAGTPIGGAHHPEIIALLAEAGADVNAKDATGRTPLSWRLYMSSFLSASDSRPGESVQALIDAGADTTEGGFTPLHWSAATGDVEKTRQLIRAGADIHAVDERANWTPLHVAAFCDQAASIRVLAEAGTDLERLHKYRDAFYPSPPDPDKWTALHLAAGAGNTQAVKALVDAGANVNARGTDGGVDVNGTPLHLAAVTSWVFERTRVDAIRILLDAGADPFAKTDDGNTPLDCATIGTIGGGTTEDLEAILAMLREAMKEGRE